MEFVARKRITPGTGEGAHASSADLLSPSEVVCRARGTCVVPKAVRRPQPFGRPGPCVITAAIVGAETTRAQNPSLPLTAEELGEEARRCAEAGASVIHLHVRDADGQASQDPALFRAAIRAIRARTDVIIQTSTGGAVGMTVAERAGPLELGGPDAPEMATLNVGSINFGEDVFLNRPADTVAMAERIRAHGAVPEVEIYDAGHLDIAADLVKRGLISSPIHFQFVLGVRGALSASARNLEFLIERLVEFGAGSSWGVAGIGRHQLPMAELAITWGGNARVGLEDNIYLDKGVLSQGSAPLVERVVAVCRARGRAVATPDEARRLLGLTRREAKR
jgi:3-keto-5-aminohexanoate cleavage enzyme